MPRFLKRLSSTTAAPAQKNRSVYPDARVAAFAQREQHVYEGVLTAG